LNTRIVDPVLQVQPVNLAGGIGGGAPAQGQAGSDTSLAGVLNALPPTAAGPADAGAGLVARLESSDAGFPVVRVPQDTASAVPAAGDSGVTGDQRLFVYEGVQDGRAAQQFQVSRDAFAHTDPAAIVKLDAKDAFGGPLPGWIRFDPVAGVFTGVPPAGVPAPVDVLLTARDTQGREASLIFKLDLDAGR
jgi:hypothetical protein